MRDLSPAIPDSTLRSRRPFNGDGSTVRPACRCWAATLPFVYLAGCFVTVTNDGTRVGGDDASIADAEGGTDGADDANRSAPCPQDPVEQGQECAFEGECAGGYNSRCVCTNGLAVCQADECAEGFTDRWYLCDHTMRLPPGCHCERRVPEGQVGFYCYCEMDEGAICRWEALDQNTGTGGNAEYLPVNSCGLGTCQEGGPVYVENSQAVQPVGQGGDIRPGKYVLVSFVTHGERICRFIHDKPYYQTLLLRADEGAIVDDDSLFLHWGGRFIYSTEANAIDIDMTCYSVDNRAPWGPFGPFETFTAEPGRLELFSAECGFRVEYRLISSEVP